VEPYTGGGQLALSVSPDDMALLPSVSTQELAEPANEIADVSFLKYQVYNSDLPIVFEKIIDVG
jgi:hypothetical protein